MKKLKKTITVTEIINTRKTTKKGTSTILLYVKVPVIIEEEVRIFPDGSESSSSDIKVKLLKSKLKFNMTKQDVIDSFNDTDVGEIKDCFEEGLK